MTDGEPNAELEGHTCPHCAVQGARFAPELPSCDGTGFGPCRCGGDRCRCHWHGLAPCRGCDECMGTDAEPSP